MCDRGKKSSLHTASRECVAPNMTRPWSSRTHRRRRSDNGSGRRVNPVFMQQAGSVLHWSWHVREAVKMPRRLCDASWRTDLGEASDHKARRVLQTKEVGFSFSVKLELKGSPDEEASTGLKCKIDLHSFSVKLRSSLFKTDIWQSWKQLFCADISKLWKQQ